MAKHRDRAFFLTVSVFALCLAAAGAWAIVHSGSRLGGEPAQSNQTAGQTNQPDTTNKVSHPKKRASTTAKPLPASPANDASGATPAPTGSLADGLVQVVPFGSNVSQQAVDHAKALLSKYGIATWDGNRLHLYLQQPVKVELVADKGDYGKALLALGIDPSQAGSLTQDTGGFTINHTIIVPLYQNKTDPDLANTLAHELTHVYFNENGLDLPSWINEGLAVDDGMNMQRQVEPDVVYQGYARRMAENVLKAAAAGTLIPLSEDENTVLSASATYDIELQDWLAVNLLLQSDGSASLEHYFTLIQDGTETSHAFNTAFGESEDALNTDLTNALSTAAAGKDNGVHIDLQVPADFSGTIHVLPRGSQTWQGFAAVTGAVRIIVAPNGSISGVTITSHTPDTQAADNQTVYIDVSTTGLTYQGQAVDSFGYAIDVHNGMYGFMNSWISLKSGRTVYLTSPTVFGLSLQTVTETAEPSSVATLLQHDALT